MGTSERTMWTSRTGVIMGGAALLGAVYLATSDASTAGEILTTAQDFAMFTATNVSTLIERGYNAAPALMLGLAAALSIPLLATAGSITRHSQRTRAATQRYSGRHDAAINEQISGEAIGVSSHAFVEIVGGSQARFAILRDMFRIGREDDNDMRIPSAAVHRYHAAIYREDLGDWFVADLSGIEGNGIAVNGKRCAETQLHDGDVIDLGPGRVRFRTGHM
jgi:hypothetical protein